MHDSDANDHLEGNRLATQLAGAAVSHFLEDDRQAMLECLRQIPDPPGVWVGMLRFSALAVSALAAESGTDAAELARRLVLRVAELG